MSNIRPPQFKRSTCQRNAEIVPGDLIDQAIGKHEDDLSLRASPPRCDDDDESLVEDIARMTEYYRNFAAAILDVEKLRQSKVDHDVASCFCRMLHVNVVTALETYLSDAFINTVVNNPGLMRRFIETNPEFRGGREAFPEALKSLEEVELKARGYLMDLVWHRLRRVKQMYKDTLGVEFSTEIWLVPTAVIKRNVIVRHNGKALDGVELTVSREDIAKLIQIVEELVQDIDVQLAEVREQHFMRAASSNFGVVL